MSNRARIFILGTIIILFVLGISVYFLTRPKPTTQTTPTTDTTQNNTLQNSNNNGNNLTSVIGIPQKTVSIPPTVKPTSLKTEQDGVVQLAKVFIERYNSYSTDDNYNNIKDVQSMVTPDLWKGLSKRLSVTPVVTAYTAITADANSALLVDWKSNAATVKVQIIKVTDKNDVKTKIYQTAQVQMVKVGSDWLVDGFAWDKN